MIGYCIQYRDFTVRETCMRSFNKYSTHKRLGLRRLLDTTLECPQIPLHESDGMRSIMV
jgi:hypothetical protein